MRRPLVLLTVSATAAAAIAIPALAATKTVKVGDNYFVRDSGVPTVSVKKNDTVKWNFVGDNPHNVTVTSGPVKFRSATKSSGSYSKKVTRVGLYRIVCTIHDGQKMNLRVRSR